MKATAVSTRLSLCYKGDRDYLHGTDILNQALRWLESEAVGVEVRDIDFAFHRVARQGLTVTLGAVPVGMSAAAICAFSARGERGRAYLWENGEPVGCRNEYREEEVLRGLEIDGERNGCTLRGDHGYTEIETWVAMVKALHHAAFPRERVRWLFVRGQFSSYAARSGASERGARLVSAVGTQFTRCAVTLDGAKAGDIYFARS